MLRANNRAVISYFIAIKNLQIRQVSLVLKAGYDPNLMLNSRGSNGLQFMVNFFHSTDAHYRLELPINKAAYLSVARLLLNAGLDANAVDLVNNEPILFACIRYDDIELVEILLAYADLSIRDKNGETALMCAARFGSRPTIRLLLGHLRNLDMDVYFLRQRNKFGFTALELARAENLDCAKLLTKHIIQYGVPAEAVFGKHRNVHQKLIELSAVAANSIPDPAASIVARNRVATRIPQHVAVAQQRTRLAAAAGLLSFESNSDYESDFGTPYHQVQARVGAVKQRSAMGAFGDFDPKHSSAAIVDPFNSYLDHVAATSDDEAEYYAGRRGSVTGMGTSMSRSRSFAALPGSSGAGNVLRGNPAHKGLTGPVRYDTDGLDNTIEASGSTCRGSKGAKSDFVAENRRHEYGSRVQGDVSGGVPRGWPNEATTGSASRKTNT